MTTCTHPIYQGDNYGTTCLLCGETLAGYGYQGEGQNHCYHVWNQVEDQEICAYCEQTREYNPQEKEVARALIRAARNANPQMLDLIETWLVARTSPREIEALARTAGSKHPEQWYLIGKYFYDFKNLK